MTLAKRLKAVLDGQSKDIFLKKKHGRDPILVKAASGGTTIFIGAIVTKKGETEGTPNVDLCAKGEPVYGIIIGIAWDVTNLKNDSDDPYADGKYLWMEEIEDGDEFYVTVKTNTAVAYMDRLIPDGGFVVPWTAASEAHALNPTFSDTEVEAALNALGAAINTLITIFAIAEESCSAVASTETIILVRGGKR